MQHLEVRGAVRPLKWSLGVKWLKLIAVGQHFLGTRLSQRQSMQGL